MFLNSGDSLYDENIIEKVLPLLDSHMFIGKENSIHFEGGFSAQYLISHCVGGGKE